MNEYNDDDDDEVIISTFSELGAYIKEAMIRKNWYHLKNYFYLKKNTFLSYLEDCKRLTRVHAKNEVESDVVILESPKKDYQPRNACSILNTRLYFEERKQISGYVSNDILDYYLLEALTYNFDPINFNFIELLITEGADINFKNDYLENVLFRAVRAENFELVSYLIDKGIDYKLLNRFGCNIFHAVASNITPQILLYLASKFNKDELTSYLSLETIVQKQTPLHYAVKEGSVAIVECLINEFKVDKEARDYKNRTPLFLAAEYNKKSVVKLLMNCKCRVSFTDETKKETLNDYNGQTALYWIVTKMPDIAKNALDELYEVNQYLRKEKYYLAPLEPKLCENHQKKDFVPKSVLISLVENGNLSLLEHPVILCLIKLKWKAFGRIKGWTDFILANVYVIVWFTFAIWVHYDKRYHYDFNTPADRFRICLFITGILFTMYLVSSEISELFNEYRYQRKSNEYRQSELENDITKMKEENDNNNFAKDENVLIKRNNKFKIFYKYITNTWNLIDLLTIMLLFVCIGTHIDDIIEHTPYKAKLHIRMMSITIIFIPLRILKISRIIIPKLGTLIMVLYYAVSDMLIWILLYTFILLSFNCSFWIVYSGTHLITNDGNEMSCERTPNNCTIVNLKQFERFDYTAYYLYRLTFGNSLNEADMALVDNFMMNPLIGSYIGVTYLVLLNIFIALLSTTFSRVFEKARAYIVLQRAIEILDREKSMNFNDKKFYIDNIRKFANPLVQNENNMMVTQNISENLLNLQKEIKSQNKHLANFVKDIEYKNTQFNNQLTINQMKLDKIESELSELKDIIFNCFNDNKAENKAKKKNLSNYSTKSAKMDFLVVKDT